MRNDRDNEVLNDSPRLLPVGLPPNTNVPGLKSLQLQASSVIFKTDAAGAVMGSTSILLTANLRAITGTPVFTVKSGTATLTSGSGPETRTLQFANMSTDSVVIEVSVEDTSTFKPTGNEPNTVYKDEVMIAKVADGSVGQDGQDGDAGPRTATGYLYYQYSSSSAPTKPSASSFNFSTGTFGSLTSNWSSTPPTFQAGNSNRYWYVYYAVRELSYGGSQTVSTSTPRQGIGFSGLVTFSGTTLTNGSSSFNYTQIDGGWIKTGTLDASRVNVTNLSADNITSGALRSLNQIQAGTSGLVSNSRAIPNPSSGTYSPPAKPSPIGSSSCRFLVSSAGYTYLDTVVTYGHFFGSTLSLSSTSANPFWVYSGSSSGIAGRFQRFGSREVWLASSAGGVDVRSGGYYDSSGVGYLPFTGAHQGLLLKSEHPTPGDILLDEYIVFKKGVSDAVGTNTLSSLAYDKTAVGVYARRSGLKEDIGGLASAIVLEEYFDKDGNSAERYVNDPALGGFEEHYDLVVFNSVGEGLINVCGQNGNLEIGDLIVTSDMPGKGMKQDDDIVRNYTVAKSREAVTFSSPDEVKQIACIYLCG